MMAISKRFIGISKKFIAISGKEIGATKREMAIPKKFIAISEKEPGITKREIAIPKRFVAISVKEPGTTAKEIGISVKVIAIIAKENRSELDGKFNFDSAQGAQDLPRQPVNSSTLPLLPLFPCNSTLFAPNDRYFCTISPGFLTPFTLNFGSDQRK